MAVRLRSGTALANILQAVGFDVKREYCVNDEGNQINILGRSIKARAQQILGQDVALFEDAYQGEYIRDDGPGIYRATPY